MAVCIPDADITTAYQWALNHARSRSRGDSTAAEELSDAATDAVMWAIEHCNDPKTFLQFAKQATRRWIGRQIGRIVKKRSNRPPGAPLPEHLEGRDEKPTRPLTIEELPSVLAFVVRLYFTDGYNVREIGLLTGQGHNTVAKQLHEAAAIIARGRIAPERAKGTKRLTAG